MLSAQSSALADPGLKLRGRREEEEERRRREGRRHMAKLVGSWGGGCNEPLLSGCALTHFLHST